MKILTRFIVDHITIASKNHETGLVTVSKKVEETKGVKFNENDFVEAVDGSNMRTEPDNEGGVIKINYLYYKPELVDVNPVGSGRHTYYRNIHNATRDGYSTCSHCGRWLAPYSRYRYVSGNVTKTFCSETCIQAEGLEKCEECGHLLSKNELLLYDRENILVCRSCLARRFSRCCVCGEIYRNSSMFRSHRTGNLYCSHCYEQQREADKDYEIDSYHTAKDHNRWKFFKTPEEKDNPAHGKLSYIGEELEIESNGKDPEEIAFEARKILNKTSEGVLTHFEHDGSLNNGLEIIFNPMTINYIYSQETLLKTAFEALSKMAKSHDTSSCGLHIHYSRNFFTTNAIARLVYLFEKHRPNLEKFARRKDNRYCHFYGWENVSLDYVKRHIDYGSERYRAVNLRNDDTIEIRIFKGTLKFSTFMASIELVNNIMQVALNVDDEVVSMLSFGEIVDYIPTKYLKDYCTERGIDISHNPLMQSEVVEEKPIQVVEKTFRVNEEGDDMSCVLPF